MNILVIGSEGFIGHYLIPLLVKAGHQITGMDIIPSAGISRSYTYFPGDIMNKEDLAKAMDGAQIVINLAAKHHDFGISREEFFQINEEGTRRILEAMVERGIKKFVFYSSVAVYGDVAGCSSEATPLNPTNDYGVSKLAAERLVTTWCAQGAAREALIIRPAVVFGPNNYANMYKLIDTIHKRRYIPVGKGDNIKSVCYVENLVEATAFLMGRMKPGAQVYNYSDYEHLTSKRIIDFIYTDLGRKPPKFNIPLGPVLLLTSVIDLLAKITRINFPITSNRIKKLNSVTWHGSDKIRALGFQQKVALKEGFDRMVKWYLEETKK